MHVCDIWDSPCTQLTLDVWMFPALEDDGSECYEYILLYTDDALAISVDPEPVWTLSQC